MALLTVVLVAALVLISIVSIAARAATEGIIVTGQNLSKKALSVAEAGLADVLTDLRSAQWAASANPQLRAESYLTPAQVTALATALAASSSGTPAVVGKVQPYPYPLNADGSWSSEYSVKVVKDSVARWDGSSSWLNQVVRLKIYSSAWVYAQASSSHDQATAAARRVVYSVYDVEFNLDVDVTETRSDLFNYGILSGGQINLGGSGGIAAGNIRSLTGIDVGSQERLYLGIDSKGKLIPDSSYVYKAISPDIPTGNPGALKNLSSWYQKPTDSLSIPTFLDLDYYRDMALAFKTGLPPYDDPDPNSEYPNTNSDLIRGVVQTYLGSGASSTPAQIEAFYEHLAADHSWELASPNLMKNLAKAVYFIEGDGKFTNKGGSTIAGTVVMNGNLDMEGGTINAGSGGLALLVQGNIEVGTGGGTVIGAIFVTGSLTTLNGNFFVQGSIAVAETVNKGTGDFTVEYVYSPGLPPVIVRVPGEGVNGTITSVGYPASGGSSTTTPWREASSANFNDPIGHPK